MNPTRPCPASPASAIFSLAASEAPVGGPPAKPSPGLIRLAASSPSPSATTVAQKK